MAVGSDKPAAEFTVITDWICIETPRFDSTALYSLVWSRVRSWRVVRSHEGGYCPGITSRRVTQLGDGK